MPEGVGHLDIGPARYLVQQNWVNAEKEAYDVYEPFLKKFDVIHDHTWHGLPYLGKLKDPRLKVIHTHHGHLAWQKLPDIEKLNLVAISRFMQQLYSNQFAVKPRFVYNGIAIEEYPYYPLRGDRFVYLGRVTKFKQPHIAIAVARKTGVPIDIVGGDHFVDDFSYVAQVKGACDGYRARYIGEIPHDIKILYLQRSRSLLLPSAFGEPFGLVAVEAMAVGRPVICLNDGALAELIVQGVTGFVCSSPDEMVQVASQGMDKSLVPAECRRRAQLFSRERMAEAYVKLYNDVLGGSEW